MIKTDNNTKQEGQIKLSPKYGLNPTIPICFWCGKEKNEVALLGQYGKNGEDLKAPKNAILNYEPCAKCKACMKLGLTVIEVSPVPIIHQQPEIQNGIYPTGRWLVMKTESAQKIFDKQLDGSKGIFVSEKLFSGLLRLDMRFGDWHDSEA